MTIIFKSRSFQYRGKDSKNISLYWLLLKLLWSSSTNSYEQVQEEMIEIQRNLKEIIDHVEHKKELDKATKELKIMKIKKILSVLHNRMV